MSKLTLAEAISEFGASAKAKLTNSGATGQPEDQLRAPLERLFETLAEVCGHAPGAIVLVGETSLSDMKTRPDYSVTVGIGKAKALVGFIEVKAPGKGADPRKFKDKHDKEQWAKLKALPNLIYTDGNAISLWQNGELVDEIVKFDGDIETAGAKLTAPASLIPLISAFLTWAPISPKGPTELAVTAARLCRYLRDEVLEQVEQGNSALNDLAEDWRGLLFPDASNAQFADGYAQAVTFGLLMAKSKKIELAEGLDKVAKELGKSNTLIGTALRLLTEQDELLGPSLDTLVRVLDVVDWDIISKGDPEAWINFYELFLEVYDNRLRKLTGSYYTPPQVVRSMVRLCDEALRSRFAKPAGLADPDVQIADPAVGSGTFLLALLHHIADWIKNEEGDGAIGPYITEAAKRLFGFELQFGPFAVAQLRLLAEMIDLKAKGVPRLFVTDTLGDPHAAFERGQGIYAALSKSQEEANEIKRTQPITVVIGNPPYKEKAKGKGAWVENGSGNTPAPLQDWQPPKKWGIGAHAKHLRNLYIYFWRWAAWKVFEQGSGGRDLQPPVEEKLSGIVCYITVAGFLNGPGFQKMRSDLRRDCDEIWVIDCSPEGHQPEVATRIFQGVQHPVCIVLAARSPGNDPNVPAKVRFKSLAKGPRDDKFKELATISVGGGWMDCAAEWRAPFLPELAGGWADFVPLDQVIGDSGSGVMPGRTWVIAPDAGSLKDRWNRLIAEKDSDQQASLFHPHLREDQAGDRHIGKGGSGLTGSMEQLASVEFGIEKRDSGSAVEKMAALQALQIRTPVPYGFRSFDRQWIIPDSRVINQPNPKLWARHGSKQVYLTAPMDRTPTNGPALSATYLIPDLHHYAGRGGRTLALWNDAAATQTNVKDRVIAALTLRYGTAPDPADIFAYVAVLLANPAYTVKFQSDLIRPGLRVPLTADRKLFDRAAKIGREVLWLHTYGERFSDGHPAGLPKLPQSERPIIPAGGTIPSDPAGFPDEIDYDPVKRRLKVGKGYIDNVDPRVWAYEVSGKQVLRQWFSYRKKDRERPQIGDRRKPSPLGDIQPDHWLPEYTTELLNLLNVLGLGPINRIPNAFEM